MKPQSNASRPATLRDDDQYVTNGARRTSGHHRAPSTLLRSRPSAAIAALAARLAVLPLAEAPTRTVQDIADLHVINSMCLVIVPHRDRDILAVTHAVGHDHYPDFGMEVLGCSLVISAAQDTL